MSKEYKYKFSDMFIDALGILDVRDNVVHMSSSIVNPTKIYQGNNIVEGPLSGQVHIYDFISQYGLAIPRVQHVENGIKYGNFFFGTQTGSPPTCNGVRDLNGGGGYRTHAKNYLIGVTKEEALEDFRCFVNGTPKNTLLDQSLEILMKHDNIYLLSAKSDDETSFYLVVQDIGYTIKILGRAAMSLESGKVYQHVYWELPQEEVEKSEVYMYLMRDFLAYQMSHM